jgi:hypothetical protein
MRILTIKDFADSMKNLIDMNEKIIEDWKEFEINIKRKIEAKEVDEDSEFEYATLKNDLSIKECFARYVCQRRKYIRDTNSDYHYHTILAIIS